MNSDSIVMWVTRLSIVDCFSKTAILLATFTTQNQPRVESYVFLEVEHLFQSVGCVRNNRQYPRFYRIRNHIVGCWTANGWITCSRFMECGDRSVMLKTKKEDVERFEKQAAALLERDPRAASRDRREWQKVVDEKKCTFPASPSTRSNYQRRVGISHA